MVSEEPTMKAIVASILAFGIIAARNSHRAEYPCAAGHHRRRVCWAQLLAGHAADQAQISIPRDASAGLVKPKGRKLEIGRPFMSAAGGS